MLTNFFGVEFSRTVSKFRKRKRKLLSCVRPSSTKREKRHFHVVVVQRRQRNVQKRVMHVQSFCYDNLILLLFCRSCCRRRRRCLSSLIWICGWVTLRPSSHEPGWWGPIPPWLIWEISARFPRWKKAEDTDWRQRVLVRNSRNEANMAKHKVITFAPIIVLATLIAVSLQLNGMLMMWKIQQTKKDGTELIRRTHPSFISVTTTTMLGGPCHIAC